MVPVVVVVVENPIDVLTGEVIGVVVAIAIGVRVDALTDVVADIVLVRLSSMPGSES